MQPTPTRSPTLYFVTEEPTAETMPAISCPGTIGKMAVPHSSRTWWMSLWQMPANLTSIWTSSSRSARRSISAGSSGAPAAAGTRAGVWLTGIPLSYGGGQPLFRMTGGQPLVQGAADVAYSVAGSGAPEAAAGEATLLGSGAADGWRSAVCG